MPDLISRLTQQQAPSAPVADASGYYPDATVTAPAGPNLRGADMGSIIAALAGSQGDKVDVGQTVGAITAMLGGDEDARRGMIAQGHTPGKDFALTADRADAIAGMDNAASLAQAIGVARINHRDDIPVASIQAITARRGQDIGSTDKRRGQDISAAARREAAAMRGPRAASNSAHLVRPIAASEYKMLFGNLDDDLGELGKHLDIRNWPETPNGVTLSRIRSAMIDEYRRSGNHVQAIRDVLDAAKRRWDAKKAAGQR